MEILDKHHCGGGRQESVEPSRRPLSQGRLGLGCWLHKNMALRARKWVVCGFRMETRQKLREEKHPCETDQGSYDGSHCPRNLGLHVLWAFYRPPGDSPLYLTFTWVERREKDWVVTRTPACNPLAQVLVWVSSAN